MRAVCYLRRLGRRGILVERRTARHEARAIGTDDSATVGTDDPATVGANDRTTGIADQRTATVADELGYAWTEAWKSSLSGYWTYSRKNDVNPGGVNALVLEAFNSNNTVYRINVDHTYTRGPWSIGPTASYLERDANAYSPVTLQFIPAKHRCSLGGVGGYATSATSALNFRIERIWTHESDNAAFAVPTINSQGWLVTGGGVIQF